MTRLTRSFSFFLLISMVLLSSCDEFSGELTSESCIPPVAKLAYPIVPPTPGSKQLEIGPLGKWEFQSSLPRLPEIEHVQIVARSGKIWVLPLGGEVFSYDSNARTWKIYEGIGGAHDSFRVVPEKLFLAKDETLWGIGTRLIPAFGTRENFPLLSKYDDGEDRFEFIRDTEGLLNNVLPISFPPDIARDQAGLLWFFGRNMSDKGVGLYSFDPSTRKAQRHLALPWGGSYKGPVVAPDGNLWFYSIAEPRLFIYSPHTSQAVPYSGLPRLDRSETFGVLFFDHQGRLWLGNKGWLDFTHPDVPIWYELIPSPVFLTDHGWFPALGDGLPSRYGWVVPSHIYQSSNGWLWFTANGTIRLDLEKGEWCLFTTGSSPVVEDEEGNLWIVVFGKLYKYQLER